jgi:UDP-N-acetylmuramate dehydrogenase
MSLADVENLLGDKLLRNEPLAKYTAARIGGPAEFLYVADKGHNLEMVRAVLFAWEDGIPVRIIGSGANVLVSDAGVRGLVIVNRVRDIHFRHRGPLGQEDLTGVADVTAGVSLTRLAHECASNGLTGFEWAVSVPGTVGGAVVNNAGAHGRDMSDSVQSVGCYDMVAEDVCGLTLADLAYGYRTSALKTKAGRRFVVTMVTLHFQHDDPDAIRARMDEYRAHRKRTQPPGASLGSIFKNPDGDYAGRLIEAAGLKGHTIGGAAVSDKHANFFINTGGATATDYAALVWHVQREVEARFGVRLETEIEMIGEGF